jgi:hypothetical protein
MTKKKIVLEAGCARAQAESMQQGLHKLLKYFRRLPWWPPCCI